MRAIVHPKKPPARRSRFHCMLCSAQTRTSPKVIRMYRFFAHAVATAATFVLLAACSGNSGSGDAADSNDTTAKTEWRFALEEIEGSVQDTYAQEFKRRIEERSDGAIEIKIYPYGQIGTSSQLTEIAKRRTEACSAGAIAIRISPAGHVGTSSQLTEIAQRGGTEIVFASPRHLADLIPEVGVFTLHFLLSEHDEVNREVLSDEKIRALFQPEYHDQDLELLDIIPEGWMIWSANKPLRTLDDLKDFRIRTMTSPILVASYKAYGASPTPMPYAEVYSGLQLGQLDGQVNPMFAIEEMSFYEEQDYLISARHAQFVSTLAANRDWFESLPEEQRELVNEVRDELVDWIDDKQIAYQQERLEKILAAGGTEYIELDDEERQAFRDASMSVRDVYIDQTGDSGREILDTISRRVEEADAELEGR